LALEAVGLGQVGRQQRVRNNGDRSGMASGHGCIVQDATIHTR
jgi:hypothetical protein